MARLAGDGTDEPAVVRAIAAAASAKLGYKGCMPVEFAEKWQGTRRT